MSRQIIFDENHIYYYPIEVVLKR